MLSSNLPSLKLVVISVATMIGAYLAVRTIEPDSSPTGAVQAIHSSHEGVADTLEEHGVPPAYVRTAWVDAEAAGFSVQAGDIVSASKTVSVFPMPGDSIQIEALFTQPGDSYWLQHDDGTVVEEDESRWTWIAPTEPGVYTMYVTGPHDEIRVRAFVMHPFNNDSPNLDGYRIGSYERHPMRGDPKFLPPVGLVRMTSENEDLQVSPHFSLGQFQCKQAGDPKYLLVDPQLVAKLELLLQEVRKAGIEATSFVVMSGYRTPQYNRDIGNTTRYSSHLFGRAADIYIDENDDGVMDDLNGDGRINREDARMLYAIADNMDEQAWGKPFLGGLGLYGSNAAHGPFVHVDARGYRARW